jgi:hypothetical protein
MRRWTSALAIVAVALVTSGCITVVRSSVGTPNVQGDAQSVLSGGEPISDNGRFVAFESTATNLVPGDTNGVQDVFRRDNSTGRTIRVSAANDGAQIGAASEGVALSGDGQHVAFTTSAALEPADTNGEVDVYVRSIRSGTTERVSIRADGTPILSAAVSTDIIDSVSISDDGRFVAMHYTAVETGVTFVRDRQTRTTTTPGDGLTSSALLSGDGRSIIVNHLCDVGPCFFQSTLLSLTGGPSEALTDQRCGFFPFDVSTDARFVVGERVQIFASTPCAGALGLVRWDRTTKEFKQVPVDTWVPTGVSMSNRGRFVAVLDAESFVRVVDLATGAVQIGDTDMFGNPGPGRSGSAALSGSGRYLAFTTLSPITPDDDNHVDDVFTRYAVRPDVETISPPSVSQGSSPTVEIRGSELLPRAEVSVSGEGVTIESVTVVSPAVLSVHLAVDANAPTGARDVVVHNTGGFGHADAHCVGCLEVVPDS